MKRSKTLSLRRVYPLFAVALILALVLGACAKATPAPVEPAKPVEPEAPVATEAPVEAPAVTEAPAAAKPTTVVIYTPKENEEVADYIPVASQALPDLKLDVLRLSTGDLTARLLAEKNNPQADLIWGIAVSSIMILKGEGMLEPYTPVGVEGIRASFRDPADPPEWVGIDGYVNMFCVNTIMAEEKNLPIPKSWADLLDPVYEGQIVMPDPASSGTGYMFVASVLQGMGEEAGYEYLKSLDKNMAMYTKSGSKPCKMVAAGEYAVAISHDLIAARLVADGAPIEIVVPAEGSGWEMEVNALMKGAKNPEGAKRFLDWAITDEAQNLYATYFSVIAKDGFPLPQNVPQNLTDLLFPMDFKWSAENRDAVLAQWAELFTAEKKEAD